MAEGKPLLINNYYTT